MSTIVTKKTLAQELGCTAQYVSKLIRQGRVVLTEDGRQVKLEESIALIRATEGGRTDVAQRHAEGRQKTEQPQQPEQPTASDDQRVNEARLLKSLSDARRAAAQADQEEMERDKMAGKLLAKEDVDYVLQDYGATLRSLLENLPDSLAPVVAPLTTLEETHAAISEAVEGLQQQMADTMKRRAEEMGEKHQ
ncbi:MAG: hypothetical protein IBX58_14380 [Roseovarius sp.]|nr:hypothetical protein [Roseovarius sp.]